MFVVILYQESFEAEYFHKNYKCMKYFPTCQGSSRGLLTRKFYILWSVSHTLVSFTYCGQFHILWSVSHTVVSFTYCGQFYISKTPFTLQAVSPLSFNYRRRFACHLVTQWQNVHYLASPTEVFKCLNFQSVILYR